MDVQLVVERFKVGLPPCADAQLVALLVASRPPLAFFQLWLFFFGAWTLVAIAFPLPGKKRLNFKCPVDSMLPQVGHVRITLTKTYGGGNFSTTADVVAFAPIIYHGSAGAVNDPVLRIQRY